MGNATWIKVTSGAYNLVENGVTVAQVRKCARCEWTYSVGDLWGTVATRQSGKAAVSRLRKGL